LNLSSDNPADFFCETFLDVTGSIIAFAVLELHHSSSLRTITTTIGLNTYSNPQPSAQKKYLASHYQYNDHDQFCRRVVVLYRCGVFAVCVR
jgi:hypothetical protein